MLGLYFKAVIHINGMAVCIAPDVDGGYFWQICLHRLTGQMLSIRANEIEQPWLWIFEVSIDKQ